MPKHLRLIVCFLGAALVLAGCRIDESPSSGQQGQGAGAPAPAAGQGTDTFGGGAGPNGRFGETFRQLNQLAAGTLYLQGTGHPITAEQAAILLPLWQSLQTTLQDEATNAAPPATPGAPVDTTQISSTLDKIQAALAPDQMSLINNMTQEQIAAVYQQQGIAFGPPGGGTPGPRFGNGTLSPDQAATLQARRAAGQGGGPGNGTLSPDQAATLQARRAAGGGRVFFGSPLIDAVIKMLQGLAGQQ